MAITITSSGFTEGGMIPKKHTCDAEDISPDLKWSGVPKEAKSLALICDDPDAPVGTWVHWVLFNIPADVTTTPSRRLPRCRSQKWGLPWEKRLPQVRLRRPLPARRDSPLFFQDLCSRHSAQPGERQYQIPAACRHEGPHPGRGAVDGEVQALITLGRLRRVRLRLRRNWPRR